MYEAKRTDRIPGTLVDWLGMRVRVVVTLLRSLSRVGVQQYVQ